MLHKHRFAFSIVLGKKIKPVDSVNKTCARFNVTAHRQPLLVSFFPFFAKFYLHHCQFMVTFPLQSVNCTQPMVLWYSALHFSSVCIMQFWSCSVESTYCTEKYAKIEEVPGSLWIAHQWLTRCIFFSTVYRVPFFYFRSPGAKLKKLQKISHKRCQLRMILFAQDKTNSRCILEIWAFLQILYTILGFHRYISKLKTPSNNSHKKKSKNKHQAVALMPVNCTQPQGTLHISS